MIDGPTLAMAFETEESLDAFFKLGLIACGKGAVGIGGESFAYPDRCAFLSFGEGNERNCQ